ncbi:MAG: hypothetical protein ACFFDT_08460 [Candidatus Hodarchaeota archaeon]
MDNYPFYYASRLPILFYVAVAYLVISSFLVKNLKIRIALVLLLATLVEFTPVVMLTNPWVPDQYPFSAEPALLAKNHHLSRFHYLDTTPALALTFSGVLLSSNTNGLMLWQLAPIFGVVSTLLVILIGNKIKTNGVICGLLFLAFNFLYQTNIFHRQTYSFVLFLLSILILLYIIDSKKSVLSLVYIAVLFAIVLSHPGTSAFLIISLFIVAIGMLFFNKNRKLFLLTIISAVIFFFYYTYLSIWDLSRMIHLVRSAMNEFLSGDVGQIKGLEYLAGYTTTFGVIINVRTFVIVAYIGLSSLIAFYILLKRHDLTSQFVSLLHFGFAISLVAFMFGGAFYQLRPLMFLIPTSSFLIGKFLTMISTLHENKARFRKSQKKLATMILKFRTIRNPIKGLSILCLVLMFLALPILRYSGLPYLHPPSQELTAKLYLDRYYGYNSPINVTERNLPYAYSLILMWIKPEGEPPIVFYPEKEIDMKKGYFTTFRYTTRDAYWISEVSFAGYVDELLISLPESHNLVYQSDHYHKIFLKK